MLVVEIESSKNGVSMKLISLFLLTVAYSLNLFAAEPSAKVFFIEPKDKAVVPLTFKVKMGLTGMKICPANQETADKTCGHHHILIDGKSIAEGQPIANDPTHMHFGKGQTEADVTLTPGNHTLTLQFADFAHRSFGEKLSATINLTVK
jgi:hypothetical protein